MPELYDNIGTEYSAIRGTDPYIAKQLQNELIGASKIVNIGAGTGSYEPIGVDLVAVEPSSNMISQRKNGAYKVIRCSAENLPFENNTFSHAMTILSMHHWNQQKSCIYRDREGNY